MSLSALPTWTNVYHMHARCSFKFRKESLIPWNWRQRLLCATVWLLGTKPGSTARASVFNF